MPPAVSNKETIDVLQKQVDIERRLLQGVQVTHIKRVFNIMFLIMAQALVNAGHPDDTVMQQRIAQMQECARNIARYSHELEELRAVCAQTYLCQ